jgi:hypothetical protein
VEAVKDGLSREALLELRAKYAEMIRLREHHARAKAEGTEEPHAPRDMAKLAARFPGALREIDRLELGEIHARMRALEAAAKDASRAETWMRAMTLFHTYARGALAAKRWLGKRKRVDARARAAFVRDAERLGEDAREWVGELAKLARPPRGRVMDVVFDRVATALGVTASEARALVFGERPSSSRR